MKSPNLKSKRLILREWTIKDAPVFVELTKDKKLIFGDMPFPYLLEHAKYWIKTVKTLKDKYYFAVVEKKSNQIIGFCWITVYDNNEGLIVYGLGEQARGEGYGKETAKLMIDFAFKNLKLAKLKAETHADNFESHKILINCGFKVVKKAKKYQKNRFTGKLEDKWFWELEPNSKRNKLNTEV